VGTIPRIGVREVYVPQVPTWAIDLPLSIPQAPPVTLQIGFPTVEMPGCVEARETSGNNKLIEDDPQGTLTLCTGPGMPSFNPPEFDPSKELVVIPMDNSPNIGAVSGLGGNNSEKKNESTTEGAGQVTNIPDLDVNAIKPVDIDLPCPRPGSPPPGAYGKYGTKIVKGYEKNSEGECITLYEDIALLNVINNYTPPPATILNTTSIAVGATLGVALVGQPLQQYLMKVVKPLAKKVTKTVLKKILKKPEKILSVRERMAEQRKNRK
tara:strand:- start:1886 stop:2686 length:801 start_codon:yes stop_codon:yes gene_type:complete